MDKKRLITVGLVLVVLVVIAAGLYLGGSNLVQMLQAHLGG